MLVSASGITAWLDLARRRCSHSGYSVARGESFRRIKRAKGQPACRATTQVRLNASSRRRDGCTARLAAFQRPLLDGGVNLTEVVDARVLLGR